jgi:diguanylate cyclase (GGDEF)-like protein
MEDKFVMKKQFLVVLFAYIILGILGFSYLILQQENILRKYFVIDPQERVKQTNLSLCNSLSRYFIRENKDATLDQVADYIAKYGRPSLFEMVFVYKDKDGTMKQIDRSGVSPVTKDAFTSETVYPITIDSGRGQGYLLITTKESGKAELEEGLRKYKTISYSLRFLFGLLVIALLIIVFYHTYSAKMRLARDLAEIKASNDGLTSAYTHEYFMKILGIEVEKFRIYNSPLALLMLDIDYFKNFNDRYGHLAGDKVLQEVAKIIKSTTRATDIVARYGGEEFSVIIPYVAKNDGRSKDEKARLKDFISEIKNVADRIRQNVEECGLEFDSGILKVTVSVGGAFYYRKFENISRDDLLQKADLALYKAKRLGRNKVCIDYESSKPI